MSVLAQICDRLHEAGVEVVASLPDTWLVGLIRQLDADPRFRQVVVNREEAAIGVCFGAFFAGRGSAALMGTSGFVASIFAITKLNFTYEVGFPILMNLRGSPGDRAHHHYANGLYARRLLEALDIPWELLERPEQLERIPVLVHHARFLKRPVAICLGRELLVGSRGAHA